MTRSLVPLLSREIKKLVQAGLYKRDTVFEPDGRVVSRRWSGLDLVYESELERGAGPSERRLRERVEHLREGVALALDLYAAPDS